MKRVGVKEFKDKATTLISEERALVIEKHGRPVGFYIPIGKKDKLKAREAAADLEHALEAFLDETEMTEEELIAAVTEDWEGKPDALHAAGG